ncbi:hypothetical protein Avbf_13837 [Armadillidium vulgare]|nr:hypothetical protein Avbf_13837 [Armadillidium vulgare]
MLIPNPSSNVNPTLATDIDELSNYSDRHSKTIPSTTSSDDEYGTQNSHQQLLPRILSILLVREINAEFGQQDHEYTEDISKLEKLHK